MTTTHQTSVIAPADQQDCLEYVITTARTISNTALTITSPKELVYLRIATMPRNWHELLCELIRRQCVTRIKIQRNANTLHGTQIVLRTPIGTAEEVALFVKAIAQLALRYRTEWPPPCWSATRSHHDFVLHATPLLRTENQNDVLVVSRETYHLDSLTQYGQRFVYHMLWSAEIDILRIIFGWRSADAWQPHIFASQRMPPELVDRHVQLAVGMTTGLSIHP